MNLPPKPKTEPGHGFRVVELEAPLQPPFRQQIGGDDQQLVFLLGVRSASLAAAGRGDWFRGNGSGVGEVAEIDGSA